MIPREYPAMTYTKRTGRLWTAALVFTLALFGCSDDESTGGGGQSTTTTGTGGAGGGGAGGTGGSGGSVGTGGAGAGWAGSVPTLTNDAECAWWIGLAPDPGEAGHLVSARLTPPSYPFEVQSVQYELLGGEPCDSSQAHRVEVFVASTDVPPNDPTSDPSFLQLDAPAASATEDVRVVTLPLSSPITLATGEHLFVAVELPNEATSCMAMCDGAGAWDRDYWSNATSAPYSWAALETFELFAHARIGANGTTR